MCDGQQVWAVPLHHRLDLLEACANLVNGEWPRSHGARVHALKKSCQDFPVCLVLLQGGAGDERLLGHARLSRVVGQSGSLFVETVVVDRAMRGKGYGRSLMEATERYARARGFRRLCLTTHDKQHFYAHLGYVLSQPVQNAGAITSFMPIELLQKFSMTQGAESFTSFTRSDSHNGLTKNSRTASSEVISPAVSVCTPPAPSTVYFQPPKALPPPAPPLPPPTLPPPPAPPLPVSSQETAPLPPGQTAVQTLLETPYRDVKGLPIYWMHKDI